MIFLILRVVLIYQRFMDTQTFLNHKKRSLYLYFLFKFQGLEAEVGKFMQIPDYLHILHSRFEKKVIN